MAEKRSGNAEHTNGTSETMLTTGEAAARLGVSVRGFRKMRARAGAIAGSRVVDGQWAFPQSSIDALAGGADEEDDAESDIAEGQAALLREVARASKEIHASAASAIKAATDALQSVAPFLVSELTRQGEALADTQKQALENMKLLREFLVAAGELEVQRMRAEGDQAVRVERTKVAAKAMQVFMPVLKAGAARALGKPEIARDAQAETLLAVFKKITPEKREQLMAVLDEKQQDAFSTLVTYAASIENVGDSLRALKDGFLENPERMSAAQAVLDQNEITAVLSLFEGVDDDGKKPA